jgi:hypothetical protein
LLPVAVTLKLADVPTQLATETGCVVIAVFVVVVTLDLEEDTLLHAPLTIT